MYVQESGWVALVAFMQRVELAKCHNSALGAALVYVTRQRRPPVVQCALFHHLCACTCQACQGLLSGAPRISAGVAGRHNTCESWQPRTICQQKMLLQLYKVAICNVPVYVGHPNDAGKCSWIGSAWQANTLQSYVQTPRAVSRRHALSRTVCLYCALCFSGTGPAYHIEIMHAFEASQLGSKGQKRFKGKADKELCTANTTAGC